VATRDLCSLRNYPPGLAAKHSLSNLGKAPHRPSAKALATTATHSVTSQVAQALYGLVLI